MKKFVSLLLAATMLLAMLTACGSNNNAADNSGKENSTADTSKTENKTEDKAEEKTEDKAEAITYKESVVIGTSAMITTTDPQAQSNLQHDQMFKMVHDRLVNYNSATGEIEPELAESWEISDDGLVYTFHLVQGATFHDGSDFTAKDVVFTMTRGFESSQTKSKLTNLASVEATDDYTVVMTLKAPNVDWLMVMSNCVFSIISESAVTADPTDGPSVGTGAFSIKEFSSSNYVVMERNDNYWGEVAPTKEVTLRYIAENATRLIALQNGEIDMCIDPNTTELNMITEDEELELVQYQSSTSTFLCFNTSTEPGNDKNLRLAIAHAINIDDIIMVATNGYATRADHFWGPLTYGYDESIVPYEYDLEKAKEYMAASDHPDGATIKVMVSGAERMAALQVIQNQVKAIGVDIVIEEVDSAGISSNTTYAAPAHEAIVYYTSWNYEGDDARRMFYTGSNVNKAIYVNQEVMDLIDEAVTVSDDAQREAIYSDVQNIVHGDAPWIPLYFGTKCVAIDKDLSGVIYEVNQRHDFTYICVAE